MKSSAEIRSSFLRYFRERGHEVVASSPLVPANDPTLLFTNAGMVQFKDVFLGREQRPYVRAASSQRCVRAGGKHNDLENVGYTARHHTFFEMLGNFSFGDYFKREAIGFAWEYLTDTLGLPAERLWVTVYEEDDEAAEIWLNEIGIDPSRFSRIGAHDNFWSMGDTGPCGPCSEIFYDHGPQVAGGPPGSADADGDRYIEIWNLVFMQYDRDADGRLNPLPRPSVDTGMGLERIAAVMQGVHDNYEIDLFRRLIAAIDELANTAGHTTTSHKVIADHIRASAFLVVDGVLPSNEGRGYVLRRIIRRACRHGHKLGLDQPFFHRMVAPLVAEMGEAFPELVEGQALAEKVIRQEEERFAQTLSHGMSLLQRSLSAPQRAHEYLLSRGMPGSPTPVSIDEGLWLIDRRREDGEQVRVWLLSETEAAKANDLLTKVMERLPDRFNHDFAGSVVLMDAPEAQALCAQARERVAEKHDSGLPADLRITKPVAFEPLPRTLSGEIAFQLYDTYGFPLDLTQDVCREYGLTVDIEGFEAAMAEQRRTARAASRFKARDAEAATIRAAVDTDTAFSGYEHDEETATVIGVFTAGEAVDVLEAGAKGALVLNRTPFYAESGGQVGDTGIIEGEGFRFEVGDTQKEGSVFLHLGEVVEGAVRKGMRVRAEIDRERRERIRRNHSATHLLNAALRQVLGSHVGQKGSLVDAERLRFDFSHFEPVTAAQLVEIEDLVNRHILANHEAQTRILPFQEAVGAGALAMAGEKYAEEVRVLWLGEFSVELCGGTHVRRTGDIGLFKIIAEGGVAAGVRRIEAVTGLGALQWVRGREALLGRLAETLRTGVDELPRRISQLQDESRRLQKEVARLKQQLASGGGGSDLAARAETVGDTRVLAARLDGADAKTLREAVDQLKSKLQQAVIVLAGVTAENKVVIVAGVTNNRTDRIKAGDLANVVAERVGGRGGGRADMAQAGGRDAAALDDALAEAAKWVRERLG